MYNNKPPSGWTKLLADMKEAVMAGKGFCVIGQSPPGKYTYALQELGVVVAATPVRLSGALGKHIIGYSYKLK